MHLLMATCFLDQAGNVENKGERPVAKNCGPGYFFYIPVHMAEILNHCLMLADHLVYNKADTLAIHMGHDYLFDVRSLAVDFKMSPQMHVGNQFSTDIGKIPSPGSTGFLRLKLDTFLDRR